MGNAKNTIEALERMNSYNIKFMGQSLGDKIQYNNKWYTRKQLGNLLSRPHSTNNLGKKNE